MRLAWFALVAVLEGCFADHCVPGPDSTWRGTATYAVNAGASGAAVLAVQVQQFDPQGSVGRGFCDGTSYYCGPSSFPIVVAPACVLTARVSSIAYDSRSCDFISAALAIAGGAPCMVTTATGDVAFTVADGGTVGFTPTTMTLVIAGATDTGATVTFDFTGM